MSLDLLNEQQKKAVVHGEGPMMVLAGPGSGKTMVITHRIRHLIEVRQINPKKIMVITFTKAAAEEMKERFNRLMKGRCMAGGVTFGTFHSIFFKILRSVYPYGIDQIIKEETKYQVLKAIIIELGIDYEDEQEFISQYQTELSLMKNELINLEYYNSLNIGADDFRLITLKYEQYKQDKGLIDFDDMLCHCYHLLRTNERVLNYWQKKFSYFLIDEFQDINRAQYEIIKMLVKDHQNIFIVGDDDQSIYRFRGARPEFLLNFPSDFQDVEKVILNINYRSNEQIIKSSTRVINKNEKRYKKELVSMRGEGTQPIVEVFNDTEEEAKKIAETFVEYNKKGIPYDDMAVIFRTNLQARALVDTFMDYNMPFVLRDQAPSIYDHWISKDIIAYIHSALNPKDKASVIRIVNKPNRYMSKWMMNEANRSSKDFFPFIYEHEDLKTWQKRRVEELEGQLIMVKIKKPVDAIKYIRQTIGYDTYLKEYADYRKIGVKGLKEVLDELQEGAKNFDALDTWLTHIDEVLNELKLNQKNKKETANKITLSTMHGAKGLEFKIVWIISAVEGVIPHEKSQGDDDIEEERRLFYVGLTRAKDRLYISSIRTRYEEEVAVSRFLDEMEEAINVDAIHTGTIISHQSYGKGKIKKLNNHQAEVKFNGHMMTKKIDLHYCLKNKLITFIKEDE